VPVEYARKALVLGRLNVFYAFHLIIAGNKDGGVRTLEAGLRFSHDVGNGGSFFATLIADGLLVSHLRAIGDAVHLEADPLRGPLSAAQRARLQAAVARLDEGLDWRKAAKVELEGLRDQYASDPLASTALTRIISLYVAVLDDPSKLPALEEAIHSAPQQLADLIPNAKRILEAKQDLNNRLLRTRLLLTTAVVPAYRYPRALGVQSRHTSRSCLIVSGLENPGSAVCPHCSNLPAL